MNPDFMLTFEINIDANEHQLVVVIVQVRKFSGPQKKYTIAEFEYLL